MKTLIPFLVVTSLLCQNCLCDKPVTVQYNLVIKNHTHYDVDFVVTDDLNYIFATGIERISVRSDDEWSCSWSTTEVMPVVFPVPYKMGVVIAGKQYTIYNGSSINCNPCCISSYNIQTIDNAGGSFTTKAEYCILDSFIESLYNTVIE